MTSTYQSVMGIATGDIITNDYSRHRYEVEQIIGPYCCNQGAVRPYDPFAYTIRDYPVISLSLKHLDQLPGANIPGAGINSVRREHGRWFTDMGDEVFVSKPAGAPIQMGLFTPVEPQCEPYVFRPEVDYAGATLPAWHCLECGHDWNRSARSTGGTAEFAPACPVCQRYGGLRIRLLRLEEVRLR